MKFWLDMLFKLPRAKDKLLIGNNSTNDVAYCDVESLPFSTKPNFIFQVRKDASKTGSIAGRIEYSHDIPENSPIWDMQPKIVITRYRNVRYSETSKSGKRTITRNGRNKYVEPKSDYHTPSTSTGVIYQKMYNGTRNIVFDLIKPEKKNDFMLLGAGNNIITETEIGKMFAAYSSDSYFYFYQLMSSRKAKQLKFSKAEYNAFRKVSANYCFSLRLNNPNFLLPAGKKWTRIGSTPQYIYIELQKFKINMMGEDKGEPDNIKFSITRK